MIGDEIELGIQIPEFFKFCPLIFYFQILTVNFQIFLQILEF